MTREQNSVWKSGRVRRTKSILHEQNKKEEILPAEGKGVCQPRSVVGSAGCQTYGTSAWKIL